MDAIDLLSEMPTPIQVWQLPRRFDALIWYVRLQRENPDFLHHFRVSIPQTGPSLLQVQEHVEPIGAQLGIAGETLLGSGLFPWHGHEAYLENLGEWTARHTPDWPATASISWILCLHRDAWLAVASTWLHEDETSRLVKSAWLTLALGSADAELLALIPDGVDDPLHVQVYADECLRGLRWLEASHTQHLPTWLGTLAQRGFFKALWSRMPLDYRRHLEEHQGHALFSATPM